MATLQDRKSEAITKQQADLDKKIRKTDFFILLCGPSVKKDCPAAELRTKLKGELEDSGFLVVMGEDNGLEDPRLERGSDAQTNEVQFLKTIGDVAVIIIAGSVGAHCELGLFSWLYSQKPKQGGLDTSKVHHLFVIADKKYQDDVSYINEGPIKTVNEEDTVYFADFSNFNSSELIGKLNGKRARIANV